MTLKKCRDLTRDERKTIIAAYDTSPLTSKAYVASHGIGLSTFARWRYQAGLSLKKNKGHSLTASPLSPRPVSLTPDKMFMDLSPYFTGHMPSLETVLQKPPLPVKDEVSLDICVPNGMTIKVSVPGSMQAAHFIKGLL